MSTVYPSDFDDFILPGSKLDAPSHTSMHKQKAAALRALEEVVGKNPSGSYASVKDRLTAIEGSIPSIPSDIGAQPAGSYVTDDDGRLSNARTPTAHAGSHKTGGVDALTPADIGAAPAGDYITEPASDGTNGQAHTTQTGWEPPNVPALWIPQG